MLSNRSNTKRLRTQLDHDADQKARDRMAVLHREVYLNLAEAMARAANYLGKAARIDPAKENFADGFADFFAASAKAQLIAQPQTARLLTELTARYGEMVMRLVGAAMPVHDANINVRLATEQIDNYRADANRSLQELRQLGESGVPDAARFQALQLSIDQHMKMADKVCASRDAYWKEQAAAHRQFQTAMFAEMRDLGPIQSKTMAALRKELGLLSEIGDYEKSSLENWKRIDTQLGALMGKLDEKQ